jgi:hypothetical protein
LLRRSSLDNPIRAAEKAARSSIEVTVPSVVEGAQHVFAETLALAERAATFG